MATTFNVQVPDGVKPGTALQLTAPNGVQVQVQVPEGAAPGSAFAVAMPVAPAVVMATVVAPPTAPGQIGGGGLASGSSAVGFAPAVSDGLGLSNVATHSVAPDSKYGIGARNAIEVERDLFHQGGVLAESVLGLDVPDRFLFREYIPAAGDAKMTKGKHQFGAVGGNFLEMKERRNNMRMMASLPIVGACVGVVALFYWPEQIFDVRHMTGDPVATVVQEKISCPALQCCLPFLRPKTMIYDVTGMAANTPGQPPRDANAGTLMGSYFTPCFQDCCFHPCKGMLVHVRDENEKVLYRLVQDSCQPSILGGCCYLGCCYELHSEIHPVAEIDTTAGCCNGFKLEPAVGSIAPVMNTCVQKVVESQIGIASRRARMIFPMGLDDRSKLLLLPMVMQAMGGQQASDNGGGGAPLALEMTGTPASLSMEV